MGDARILYGSLEDRSKPVVLMRQLYDPEADKTHCEIEVRLPRRPWYHNPFLLLAAGAVLTELLRYGFSKQL